MERKAKIEAKKAEIKAKVAEKKAEIKSIREEYKAKKGEMVKRYKKAFAKRLEKTLHKMTDEKLFSPFIREEYADYFRNLIGMLEHAYYHFGQIVIIKKLIRNNKSE